MTFVKTKLELEKMPAGDLLQVLLRRGEPLENVPKTAVEQGYTVRDVVHVEGEIYRVDIEK